MPSLSNNFTNGGINMVYIDAVHYDRDYHGCDVITKLRWTNSLSSKATNECTKREMIDFINKNPGITKTKYYGYYGWVVGEDVRVVDNEYLRTDSNRIKADNLGKLPRF